MGSDLLQIWHCSKLLNIDNIISVFFTSVGMLADVKYEFEYYMELKFTSVNLIADVNYTYLTSVTIVQPL
jgi:hypothetical protein